MDKEMKIIISGGGTGGHIFPAISIANAIKASYPNSEILFVGAEGKMEMERVPAAGYNIVGLPVVGLQRKLSFKNLSLPFKLIKSLNRAGRIMKDFKPDIVVGVGGYASAPVLWKAQKRGIPTLIQEQNSYAGLTNKILGKKAKCICTAYQGMEKFFPKEKIILTGNPVRQDLFNLEKIKEEALEYFGLDAQKKTILILGGSLGARTMNESALIGLNAIQEQNVQLLWQSGKFYYEEAKGQLEEKNYSNVKLYDFISKMNYAYSVADIIITRSGAGTISELCIVGKPCILVPSPNVAEDHQTKNAMALVDKGAAIIVKDIDAKQTLITSALELMKKESKLATLSKNICELAKPNAARDIVENIVRIVKE